MDRLEELLRCPRAVDYDENTSWNENLNETEKNEGPFLLSGGHTLLHLLAEQSSSRE